MTQRRCLVIDDDRDFREVLGPALARRGFTVDVAEDLEAALHAMATAPPDDVVLDLRLGERSGLELIGALLEANPAARIVVLTGYASIATAVEAIKRGATHYLTKPADVRDIIVAFEARVGASEVPLAERPTPLEQLEWEHIQRTLIAFDGNISAAAKHLGLHRRTLQRKLQKRPSGM